MALAIIVGCFGQDGELLGRDFKEKGTSFVGIGRNAMVTYQTRWHEQVHIENPKEVTSFVSQLRPDEIYFLASYHHSSSDQHASPSEELRQSYEVNLFALANFLEAIRLYSPHSKLFYAASSHIFGKVSSPIQNEDHPMNPDTIYGQSKLAGLQLCRWYRKNFGTFTSVGILYNHESHLRKESFLSKKIIKTAHKISKNEMDRLIIGNLNTRVDWGYAPDFVEAFQKILALNEADDFVIATGETHTAREFVQLTLQQFGINGMDCVIEDSSTLTRTTDILCGSYQKLHFKTGWQPQFTFAEMIAKLVDHERNSK